MHEKLKDFTGIVQFIIYLAILLLSAGIAYATITSRLKVCEEKIVKTEADHDVVISLSAKLDNVSKDLQEIKADVKDIRRGIERHITNK